MLVSFLSNVLKRNKTPKYIVGLFQVLHTMKGCDE